MSYKRQPQFLSSMTSEQKYHQIVNSVQATLQKTKKIKGCSMHPNPSKRCRKCQQILSSKMEEKTEKQSVFTLKEEVPEILRLYVDNPLSVLSEKMVLSIKSTEKIRNKHRQQEPKIVKDLVSSIPNEQISINCYEKGSNQVVTNFLTYFSQLLKLRPTRQQIVIMLRHNNINVKVLAMLYIRMLANPEDIYAWIHPKLQQYELINAEMTISQFGERLLDAQNLNYDGLRLPRLPIKIQNAIDEKIKGKKVQNVQREKSRSRSREKRKSQENVRRESSSSSDDSSSSSEDSSDESDQTPEVVKKPPEVKVEKKQVEKPSISLNSLKDRIKLMSKNPQQQKQKLLERYIDPQNQVNKLHEEEGEYEFSEDEERYQMG